MQQQLVHYTQADTDCTRLYRRGKWRGPFRCLNTPFHNQLKNAPHAAASIEEQHPIIDYSNVHGMFTAQAANPSTSGELEKMVMCAGEGVRLIKEILPAAEIIKNFVEGAKEIMTHFNQKMAAAGMKEMSAMSNTAAAANAASPMSSPFSFFFYIKLALETIEVLRYWAMIM
ncbi:hypothetical protein ACLOJK_021961 [Asimina triloba]